MQPEVHAFVIIGGILLGGIYALTAIGLTLIFGVTRIFNIAHGDFVMLGALVTVAIIAISELNPFIAVVLVLAIFIAIGAGLYRGLIKPISLKPVEEVLTASIIVTLGLSMAIEDTSSYILGYQFGINFFRISYSLAPVGVGALTFPGARILSLVAIIVMAVGLWLFIRRSSTGKIIRAVTQDIEAAISLGAKYAQISAVSFGIGISMTAVAGVFLAMITSMTAYSGMPLTIKALTIVILGGMGSFAGSVVGGLLLGIVESYTALYLGANWSPPMAVILMLIILIIRPQGLFGEKS